jgi:hypothetical protein
MFLDAAGLLPLLLLVFPLLLSSAFTVILLSKTMANSSLNGTASSSPSLGNRSPLDLNESDVSPELVVELRVL